MILFFLLGISLSYDPQAVVEYANKYCKETNPEYDEDQENDVGSGVNFVIQCLIAGGLVISNCLTNGKGSISNSIDLSSCLIQKGWKSSEIGSKKFKAGYPVVILN